MGESVVFGFSNCAIMMIDSNQFDSKGKPNVNFGMDVSRSLQHTRWLLKILGVWPLVKKNLKKIEIYGSWMIITVNTLLIAFFIVPCTMHVIYVEKNPVIRLMLVGPIGFCLTNALKYCSIIFRRGVIRKCMEHAEIDWMLIENDKDREIMTRNVNVGRRLTLICATFMYTGGFSYHAIMPIWRGNTINEFNDTLRPLVYPGYDLFVDSQKSPNYEIIFYTHCLFSCVTSTITTTACNLAAIFVAHASGQIEVTIHHLRTLFDGLDPTDDVVLLRLGLVVKSHVRVLRLTAMIEMLLSEICLVEVVASTLIICLLEYYCLTEWNNSEAIAILTYFVLLMSLTFNIFIFCHIGELLKEQCCKIGRAAYMIDWYRLPGKAGLTLVMIIAMSNYPRKLSAGKMMELSVNSFGAIIKTSVVYLNMLRTMAN